MTLKEFTEQFKELQFLPRAKIRWVLPRARTLDGKRREELLIALTELNAQFETEALHREDLIRQTGEVVMTFSRDLKRIESAEQERSEQSEALAAIEARL